MLMLGTEVIAQDTFGDNALKVKFPKFPQTHTITWRYENDAELFTLICLVRHYHYVHDFVLRMPYVPHARMDRVKNPEDVFTLKYFCEVINSLNFKEVVIHDPHSEVCVALLNNVRVKTPENNVKEVIEAILGAEHDLPVMFYPDKGAMKRYDGMLGLKYAYGEKKRNWETGRIEGLELIGAENVVGKPILIVDDICSYGGTFAAAARELKAAGAGNIYMYVTHCEENIFRGAIFEENNITKVYTTDSIYRNTEGWVAADKVFVL